MKKIWTILLFLTFFGSSFLIPKISMAGCGPKTTRSCPVGQGFGCYVKNNQYCCDSQSSCDQFEIDNGQPGGTYGNIKDSGSGPTFGCTNGINTAIGCLNVLDDSGPETFLGQILGWSIGIGGGIAFLLIVYASFMVMTSAGDPARLKAGQELLTSAISGLILLIFSVFVLKFIGVDILGLGSYGLSK